MNLQVIYLLVSCKLGADRFTSCCRLTVVLTSADGFVQLASTEEYIDGQFTGNLGEVLIRYAGRAADACVGA